MCRFSAMPFHAATRRLDERRVRRGCRGTLPWYCLDHWKAQLGIEIDALEGELAGLIRERPGAIDFMRWLTEQGIHCILATNAHPRSLERKLELTGIGRHFDRIVSAHEIGCAKEGAAFWQGLTAQTGLVPERTLLVDDNHAVLSAARAHGLAHLYGVAWPDSQGQRVSGEFPCLEAFTALMAPRGV